MAVASRVAPWWQTGVVYQIYPRSFQDSNDDGVGDIRGIISRLDYLHQTLGVDAIWLSPFYPSPMADFGYDISNYVDVDPIFGTLADFDDLVREAHARGMRVIVDYVPNHTSDHHPWFDESRSSRRSAKRDWYIWAGGKPDGSPPNNWLSVFGGSAWEWDEATGQYYMHAYLKGQPDLNWRNPDVKKAMFDVLRFWLDRGVDGFRVDAAHGIMKDPALRDNPPNRSVENPYKHLGAYDSQLHIHDRGHPDVHQVYRELRQLLDSYDDDCPRVVIGEIHIFDYREWATYFGADLDELHLPFNFGLVGVTSGALWAAPAVRAAVDAVQEAVPPGGWPTYVIGNHDEHRIATRIGREQARVAAMLLLTLRGTPTVYQGEEIGMTDVDIPAAEAVDPWGHQTPGLGLGRDAERTPMQWSADPHGGFTGQTAKPWLPLGQNLEHVNVFRELCESTSMLNLYRSLLRLRRETPAFGVGSYRPIDVQPDRCFVYAREWRNQRYVVALNFNGDELQLKLSGEGLDEVVISTRLDRSGHNESDVVTLRPQEGIILH